MFCNKCGKQLSDGMRFCPGCGVPMLAVPTDRPQNNPTPQSCQPQGFSANPAPPTNPQPQISLQTLPQSPNFGLYLLALIGLTVIGIFSMLTIGYVLCGWEKFYHTVKAYRSNDAEKFYQYQASAKNTIQGGYIMCLIIIILVLIFSILWK